MLLVLNGGKTNPGAWMYLGFRGLVHEANKPESIVSVGYHVMSRLRECCSIPETLM